MRTALIQSDWYPHRSRKFRHKKKHQICPGTEERPLKGNRGRLSASQEEKPQRAPTWSTP